MAAHDIHQLIDELHAADQADRYEKDWSDGEFLKGLKQRDAQRLEEAKKLYEVVMAGGSAEDAYKLSFIFQHGDVPDDYLKAHDLAKRAMELGHPYAPKMVANSYDRWLVHTTNPQRQKYGTQSHWIESEQRYVMHPVDPTVTDEERARYQVLPLAQLYEYVAKLNRKKLK